MLRPTRRHKAGSAILIRIEVRDELTDTRPRYSPSSFPQIRLRDATGSVELNWVEMDKEETGIFKYLHQTTTSDAPGLRTMDVKITGATTTQYTVITDIYELV